jgi:hypothetical protein
MPRTSRAAVGGYCYHVLNRGNGRAAVFHKDEDFQAFLKTCDDAHLPILPKFPRDLAMSLFALPFCPLQ